MTSEESNRTSSSWPQWMLRFIASDDKDAFWDLIWSGGGSPPYRGVSFREAEAVYNCSKSYRGPGREPGRACAAVKAFIGYQPERLSALELFRLNDRIVTASDTVSTETVTAGRVLAERLNHKGVIALFLAYGPQIAYPLGNLADARTGTIEALTMFLELVDQ